MLLLGGSLLFVPDHAMSLLELLLLAVHVEPDGSPYHFMGLSTRVMHYEHQYHKNIDRIVSRYQA